MQRKQDAWFPASSSVLDAAALVERVLPRYGLAEPIQCRLISSSLNDVYKAQSGGETFYLRISRHGWRTGSEIAAETAFLAELRRRGLAVVAALPRDDGGMLSPLAAVEGERWAVLFPAAPGATVREITPEQCRAYGRLAAALHDAADAVPASHERFHIDERHMLDEPMAAIRAAMAEHIASDEMIFLEEIAARVRGPIAALPRTAPEFGFCHGDLHPGNVCFAADGRPTLFDFDCAGWGWRSYDLTVFFWNAFGERRPKRWREGRWRAFLRGYQEVRPLPAGLQDDFPLFLVARQIWLMGMDSAGHSGWPPQWLNAEWLRDMVQPIRGWIATYPILAAEQGGRAPGSYISS